MPQEASTQQRGALPATTPRAGLAWPAQTGTRETAWLVSPLPRGGAPFLGSDTPDFYRPRHCRPARILRTPFLLLPTPPGGALLDRSERRSCVTLVRHVAASFDGGGLHHRSD